MEPKELQAKADKIRGDIIKYSQEAQEEINRKQQELAALIKFAQRKIDNLEGALAAYIDLLPKDQPGENPQPKTVKKNKGD